jgi:hypothetical protein
MWQWDHLVKDGGATPARMLQRITRRDFGISVLGGLVGAAASRMMPISAMAAVPPDFTIAIIPDPQDLAGACPDNSGRYYTAMMKWIVDNQHLVLTSSKPPFDANIKAVIGTGDCVGSPVAYEIKNAEAAWAILDRNRIASITPPGNRDYAGNAPASRNKLGEHFKTGYFSATSRSGVYGSGINLGGGDMAYWVGSEKATGANTAVKFVISGTSMLILAMDFFAGNDAWAWAHNVAMQNSDCECYITTHAWLTIFGKQFQRKDIHGPASFSMAGPPYSNSAVEAWNAIGVDRWPNIRGIFCGHDSSKNLPVNPFSPGSTGWFWRQVPITSDSASQQTVQQLFVNTQELDIACNASSSQATGAGQIASVFLLSRRPALGVLEGRMISTHTENWFKSKSPSFPSGTSWSDKETLLFSVPFTGLSRERAMKAPERG